MPYFCEGLIFILCCDAKNEKKNKIVEILFAELNHIKEIESSNVTFTCKNTQGMPSPLIAYMLVYGATL